MSFRINSAFVEINMYNPVSRVSSVFLYRCSWFCILGENDLRRTQFGVNQLVCYKIVLVARFVQVNIYVKVQWFGNLSFDLNLDGENSVKNTPNSLFTRFQNNNSRKKNYFFILYYFFYYSLFFFGYFFSRFFSYIHVIKK